jgi:ATP-dependent DNA helicase PIF1
MRQLRLVTNMKAHNDRWSTKYLLRVGNDTKETDEEGNIWLPEDICMPSTGEVADIENLVDPMFPPCTTTWPIRVI